LIPTTRSDFTREPLGIRAMLRYSGRLYTPVNQNRRGYVSGAAPATFRGTPKALMWVGYLIAIHGTVQRSLDFDEFCEVIRPPSFLRPNDPVYPFELVPLA
jgi:hypothetical protein